MQQNISIVGPLAGLLAGLAFVHRGSIRALAQSLAAGNTADASLQIKLWWQRTLGRTAFEGAPTSRQVTHITNTLSAETRGFSIEKRRLLKK